MTVKTEGLGRLRFELHAGNGGRQRVASVSGSYGAAARKQRGKRRGRDAHVGAHEGRCSV